MNVYLAPLFNATFISHIKLGHSRNNQNYFKESVHPFLQGAASLQQPTIN